MAKKVTGGQSAVWFFSGIILVIVGGFLVFQNVRVTNIWYVWRFGTFGVPTGATVIPLLIGIGMLFYNHKSVIAWIVAGAGALFLLITIILSVRITFLHTSLFQYILMVGCLAGGIGLVLKSLVADLKLKRSSK